MGDPCKQDGPVAALQESNRQLDERSRQHDEDMRDFRRLLAENNRLLSKVGEVLSEQRHLHEDGQRHEKAINELFGRVRNLELLPGKASGKFFWLILTTIIGVMSSVTTAVTIMLIKHYSGVG